MTKIRQLCVCSVLTLSLAFSAYAGEIPCPGIVSDAPPPPPVVQPVATSETTTGAAIDPVTSTLLSLLQSVQSIL